jgi:hypothetical protein
MPLRNPSKWIWKGFGRGSNRALPDLNVWYPMTLRTDIGPPGEMGGGVKVHSIRVEQTNDEVAVKNIEVRVTIEGIVLGTLGIAALASGVYTSLCLYGNQILDSASANIVFFSMANYLTTVSVPFECERFLVEMRITSAPGTNQTIELELASSILG